MKVTSPLALMTYPVEGFAGNTGVPGMPGVTAGDEAGESVPPPALVAVVTNVYAVAGSRPEISQVSSSGVESHLYCVATPFAQAVVVYEVAGSPEPAGTTVTLTLPEPVTWTTGALGAAGLAGT